MPTPSRTPPHSTHSSTRGKQLHLRRHSVSGAGKWADGVHRAILSSQTGWWRALVRAPEGTAAAAVSHTNHFLSHLSFPKHGFVCLGRAMLKCNSQSTGKLISENWGRTASSSGLMANTACTQHRQSPTVYVLSEHGGKASYKKRKMGQEVWTKPSINIIPPNCFTTIKLTVWKALLLLPAVVSVFLPTLSFQPLKLLKNKLNRTFSASRAVKALLFAYPLPTPSTNTACKGQSCPVSSCKQSITAGSSLREAFSQTPSHKIPGTSSTTNHREDFPTLLRPTLHQEQAKACRHALLAMRKPISQLHKAQLTSLSIRFEVTSSVHWKSCLNCQLSLPTAQGWGDEKLQGFFILLCPPNGYPLTAGNNGVKEETVQIWAPL